MPLHSAEISPTSPPMTDFTFKKAERLKSLKIIGGLFKGGQSFGIYPLRLFWSAHPLGPGDAPVQFTVSVAKKNFKSAVARNRIKRKVREAYRLNKHRLYLRLEGNPQQYACMVLYVAKEDLPMPQIEKAMQTMLHLFYKKNIAMATKGELKIEN
ncbi:MAG: ribonuclease P protein component [Saprospiraceae bacterium]|nr:ribonuclease P protein component [Saprospiraceae bacterium]